MREISPYEQSDATGQGPGVGTLLTDPHHTRGDCRLTARAVRERWPVPEAAKAVVVERLLKIVEKENVAIPARDGMTVTVDGPADAHAIAAARVMVSMTAQNQADEHVAVKIDSEAKKESARDTYNIGCVGSIALGQEPLTPEDAKRQAQEVLARVKARIACHPAAAEETLVDAIASPTDPGQVSSYRLADL